MPQPRNVIILGGGPAGFTAGLYTGRANLAPLLFTGAQLGGQLATTSEIENYPGLGEGVTGPELVGLMQQQAERFGCEVRLAEVTKVDFQQHPFEVWEGGEEHAAKAIIVCTGSTPRMLGLESEARFYGRGVSTCATCDGFFYRGKTIAVVGGGDSAMEEAVFLTRFAAKVYLVHRRDRFRASEIMQKRTLENEKIEAVYDSVVDEVLGDEKVTGVRVKNVKTDRLSELALDGLFLAIGHTPNTELFKGQLDMDAEGYLLTDDRQHTNIPGVFAGGDVQDHVFRQAVTAAGTGCAAAIETERFLADLEGRAYPGR
jgi:thioredoxin reductase (NADPH)